MRRSGTNRLIAAKRSVTRAASERARFGYDPLGRAWHVIAIGWRFQRIQRGFCVAGSPTDAPRDPARGRLRCCRPTAPATLRPGLDLEGFPGLAWQLRVHYKISCTLNRTPNSTEVIAYRRGARLIRPNRVANVRGDGLRRPGGRSIDRAGHPGDLRTLGLIDDPLRQIQKCCRQRLDRRGGSVF